MRNSPHPIADKIKAGMTIGRLTTLERVYSDGKWRWRCLCECGKEHTTDVYTMLNAKNPSCGCGQREWASATFTKHGAAKGYAVTRLYNIWNHIRQRCGNPNDDSFKHYGARGVTLCKEWGDFARFKEWAMNHGYASNLTIDRHNHNGNYEPENCHWIPKGRQSDNTRRNIWITAFGETKLIKHWERDPRARVRWQSIKERIARGWTPEAAISQPNVRYGPQR